MYILCLFQALITRSKEHVTEDTDCDILEKEEGNLIYIVLFAWLAEATEWKEEELLVSQHKHLGSRACSDFLRPKKHFHWVWQWEQNKRLLFAGCPSTSRNTADGKELSDSQPRSGRGLDQIKKKKKSHLHTLPIL